MARVTKVIVTLRQGLPNYSHRQAEVEVMADADSDESMDIEKTIKAVHLKIKKAWGLMDNGNKA